MGWGNCGTDSNGRPIGYVHRATCDHEGCNAEIDRGLAYACGGMHGGGDGYSCEKYFCPKHLSGWAPNSDGDMRAVCKDCEKQWREECPEEAQKWDEE